MFDRVIRPVLAGLLFVAATVQGATAQLGNLGVTPYTGISVPFGNLADYSKPGLSMGLQVEYPLLDGFDITLNADRDQMSAQAPGIPTLFLWRYQAGLESALIGRSSSTWALRGQLGVGATSFRSREFYPNQASAKAQFEKTYFTGTAGLELVLGTRSNVHGFLASRLNWTPMKEADTDLLRSGALVAVDPLKSAITVPVTLGLRIRTT
jgi:hypothetical protein